MSQTLFEIVKKRINSAITINDLKDNKLWDQELSIAEWISITRLIEKKFGKKSINGLVAFLSEHD